PVFSALLALQLLQRFGSFLNPLSAKNICSPAVKTNSEPHSEHFSTLSWYSMEAFPLDPKVVRERADFARRAGTFRKPINMDAGQCNVTADAQSGGTGLGLLGLRARLCKLHY